MRPYTAEETETYDQYKDRKEMGWKDSIKSIMIEIKDSSLKEADKDKMHLELIRMLLR